MIATVICFGSGIWSHLTSIAHPAAQDKTTRQSSSSKYKRLALAAIADAGRDTEGGWVEFAAVEQYLGRPGALAALKNLRERDILEERASGERLAYRFQIELSRLWVARSQPLARVLLEWGIEA
jgi:hypothetical protein